MFVCVLCLPRVEAGKNTSPVIPESRKRRREGNPVVSDLYILPTECICVFRMVLAVNSINWSRSVAGT
jgi:hypothetical protein